MIWRAGELLYNLEIQINLDPITVSKPAELSQWGDHFIFAKKIFEGKKHVTKRGYLLNGHEFYNSNGHLMYCHATLNLNENIDGLSVLRSVMERKQPYSKTSPLVKLRYRPETTLQWMPEIEFVKAEGPHLYLPLVRENLDLKRLIK